MASFRQTMEDFARLDVEDKARYAVQEMEYVYEIIKSNYAQEFASIYDDKYGYIAFLVDLMKVGIMADGELRDTEIQLIRIVCKEVFGTLYSEREVAELYESGTKNDYKLVQQIVRALDGESVKHIYAFLCAVMTIDRHVDDAEVAFVESLFR